MRFVSPRLSRIDDRFDPVGGASMPVTVYRFLNGSCFRGKPPVAVGCLRFVAAALLEAMLGWLNQFGVVILRSVDPGADRGCNHMRVGILLDHAERLLRRAR